ncbi:hypothetical protein CEUSTIGMA_g6036.t1 [Chlamydomonas eustigma]|uniref:Uncharacterized protein n=1 Tax=Chlamydomonas eustigma TaxID=1157962 RepID=A0A250X6A3_9CHLO|nr:hypothetical protein CEUSTIGMA_g6036.t1 [Chlamydomonas eustigma]|eukprot:GAX78597.1 hypothetical protein CEUSTIGMA_g6036.t1 [Chlamydomonas eustigma]
MKANKPRLLDGHFLSVEENKQRIAEKRGVLGAAEELVLSEAPDDPEYNDNGHQIPKGSRVLEKRRSTHQVSRVLTGATQPCQPSPSTDQTVLASANAAAALQSKAMCVFTEVPIPSDHYCTRCNVTGKHFFYLCPTIVNPEYDPPKPRMPQLDELDAAMPPGVQERHMTRAFGGIEPLSCEEFGLLQKEIQTHLHQNKQLAEKLKNRSEETTTVVQRSDSASDKLDKDRTKEGEVSRRERSCERERCERDENKQIELIEYLHNKYNHSHKTDKQGLSSSKVIKKVLKENGWTMEHNRSLGSRHWKQQSGCDVRHLHHVTNMKALLHFIKSSEHKHLIMLLYDSVIKYEQGSCLPKKLKTVHDVGAPHPASGSHAFESEDSELHRHGIPVPLQSQDEWITLKGVISSGFTVTSFLNISARAMRLIHLWMIDASSGPLAVRIPAEVHDIYAILQDAKYAKWRSCLSKGTQHAVCAQLLDASDAMNTAAIMFSFMRTISSENKTRIAENKTRIAENKTKIGEGDDDDNDVDIDDVQLLHVNDLMRELDIANDAIYAINKLRPKRLKLSCCQNLIDYAISLEDKIKLHELLKELRKLLFEDMTMLKNAQEAVSHL